MYIKVLNLDNNIENAQDSAKYNKPLKVFYGCQKDFPQDLSCFYHFLSDQELERSKRFKKCSDERTYVIVHALVNRKISELLNINFGDLTIDYFKNQKPYVHGINIDFNLSHSSDYFAFAISNLENTFVGVDIEEIKENLEIESIINNYFHKNEIQYLSKINLPQGLKRQIFYELWTRKESFLKMLGIGLVDAISELNMLPGERTIPNQSNFLNSNASFSNNYTYTLALTKNLILSLSTNCPVNLLPIKSNVF